MKYDVRFPSEGELLNPRYYICTTKWNIHVNGHEQPRNGHVSHSNFVPLYLYCLVRIKFEKISNKTRQVNIELARLTGKRSRNISARTGPTIVGRKREHNTKIRIKSRRHFSAIFIRPICIKMDHCFVINGARAALLLLFLRWPHPWTSALFKRDDSQAYAECKYPFECRKMNIIIIQKEALTFFAEGTFVFEVPALADGSRIGADANPSVLAWVLPFAGISLVSSKVL